jgi:3'(2'), 5'-bisphosphate nucleotidase
MQDDAMNLRRELDEALDAIQTAAQYVMEEYARFTPMANAPSTISTEVDRGSQELILKHLRRAFPADRLVAEEATPTVLEAPQEADRIWIVDPIDGTRGFVMKNGEFSLMIGLAERGEPILGVVFEPILQRLTYASRGAGCWVKVGSAEPVRCQVSSNADAEQLALVVSHQNPGKPSRAVRTLKPTRLIETFSAGIKLAIVARGEADAYVNSYAGFHDWDVCAGHVLVEEAGGQLSEFRGGPVRYGIGQANRGGFVASNSALHREILARLPQAN